MDHIPSLPPLYFQNRKDDDVIPLPSEILTSVLSYLDWGDYARLAPVHSTFKSIMHDAAAIGGHDSKWSLAKSLLDGTNGLKSNASLAIQYLEDLSAINIDEEPNEETYQDPISNETYEQYFPPAMMQLATCFLRGYGTSQDSRKGLGWLRAASRYGNVDAAFDLATIYEYGKFSVDVDIVLAAEWFLGAARAGHVESMAEYAMCCELGCGVEQSDNEALDWYTKAAGYGHITSNFSIGEFFEKAQGGLPQSDSEAVLWYYKAALMGDEDSRKALNRLNDIARIVVPGWAATLNV